jgi:hypothetical protein
MENQVEKKTRFFKGAGYLIGFLMGTAAAVLFVAISGVEALIGAIAASVSIPAGIALEEKFQGKGSENRSKGKTLIIAFLVLGFVFLAVTMLLTIQANIQI